MQSYFCINLSQVFSKGISHSLGLVGDGWIGGWCVEICLNMQVLCVSSSLQNSFFSVICQRKNTSLCCQLPVPNQNSGPGPITATSLLCDDRKILTVKQQ